MLRDPCTPKYTLWTECLVMLNLVVHVVISRLITVIISEVKQFRKMSTRRKWTDTLTVVSTPQGTQFVSVLKSDQLKTFKDMIGMYFEYSSSSSSSSSSCSWMVSSVILFLNPQDEVGPSTSSLVVPCSFVHLVYIVMLVLVVYLCPSSVRVVATFSGTVLFPLLYSVLLFFP